jgi:hypothetical protein
MHGQPERQSERDRASESQTPREPWRSRSTRAASGCPWRSPCTPASWPRLRGARAFTADSRLLFTRIPRTKQRKVGRNGSTDRWSSRPSGRRRRSRRRAGCWRARRGWPSPSCPARIEPTFVSTDGRPTDLEPLRALLYESLRAVPPLVVAVKQIVSLPYDAFGDKRRTEDPLDPLQTLCNPLKALWGAPDFGAQDLWHSLGYHPSLSYHPCRWHLHEQRVAGAPHRDAVADEQDVGAGGGDRRRRAAGRAAGFHEEGVPIGGHGPHSYSPAGRSFSLVNFQLSRGIIRRKSTERPAGK